jgi:hypothetical protein
MINQAQVTDIRSRLSEYTCPICGGKHFTIFQEKQQFIWNNDGSPTMTRSPNSLRVITAICDQCQYVMAFRTDD